MQTKKTLIINLVILLAIFVFSSNAAIASIIKGSQGSATNNPKNAAEQRSETSTVKTGIASKSTWLLPQTPTNASDAIRVEAGSAIPIKFRLVNTIDSKEITSGSVTLSTETITCPSNVPSPYPSATSISSNSIPGKSKMGEITYQGKSWNATWKLNKLSQGCFKFKVSMNSPAVTLYSPNFVVFQKK